MVHITDVGPKPSPNPTASPSLTPTPDIEEQKIAQAIISMVELRLNAMPGVQVVRGDAKCEDVAADRPRFQVNSSLKLQTRTGASTERIVERLLEYDVVKFERETDPQKKDSCKQVTLVSRSEPISLKTAFSGIVRMSNLVRVVVEEESAQKKILVDVVAVTGSGASPQVKDRLGNAILTKLTDQKDLEVRSFGDKPGTDSDYVVTGELDQQGATFVVRNLKSSRNYSLSLPGRVGEPDTAEFSAFLQTAATRIANTIREDRNPLSLTESEAVEIESKALTLLCKQENSSPDCVPQPAQVLPDLLRLKDSNRVTPKILGLLGDAYANQQNYQKAVEAYDEAVERSNNASTKETLSWRLGSAEAAYKAQQYARAAERYNRVIELAPATDATLLTPGLFVQATRSYRFASEPVKALDHALQGLREFPGSVELDREMTDTLKGMSGPTLVEGYETLVKYKDLDKAARKANEIKIRLADQLIPLELLVEHKYEEARQSLQLVERLGVASLPQETQNAYRIASAFLARQAGSDAALLVSELEAYARGDSELAFVARYFMAETLYMHPRSTADYERASTLLRQITDKYPDDFVLQLLVKVNHQLGKNKETRQYLEQLITSQKADDDAQAALAILCVDYIGDLICGNRAITALPDQGRNNRELLLRLASIRIFWAQYDVAESLFPSLSTDTQRSLMEVELFYRVWTQLALSRANQAQDFLDAWRTRMASLRRANERIEWVFDAALSALESEQALTADNKKLLREMIAAMRDPKQPIPTTNVLQRVPATGL